jgi:hypothetical protein
MREAICPHRGTMMAVQRNISVASQYLVTATRNA